MYQNLDFLQMRCTAFVSDKVQFSESLGNNLESILENYCIYVVTSSPSDLPGNVPNPDYVLEWGFENENKTHKISFRNQTVNVEVSPCEKYTTENLEELTKFCFAIINKIINYLGLTPTRLAVAPTCALPIETEQLRVKMDSIRPSICYKNTKVGQFNYNYMFEIVESIGNTSFPINYVASTIQGTKIIKTGNNMKIVDSLIFEIDINTNTPENYRFTQDENITFQEYMPPLVDDFIKFVLSHPLAK